MTLRRLLDYLPSRIQINITLISNGADLGTYLVLDLLKNISGYYDYLLDIYVGFFAPDNNQLVVYVEV